MKILDGIVLMDSKTPYSEAQRVESMTRLYPLVVSAVDLSLKIKHAHWNVRGEGGFAYHKLFDKLHGYVLGISDSLAERCGALGCYINGLLLSVTQGSLLPPYDTRAISPTEHVSELTRQFAILSDKITLPLIELQESDPVTSNLLADIKTDLDKSLYFLELNLPT